METNEVVTTKNAGRESKLWIEHLQQTIRETPGRLEDAAKYISTMISISLTIFLAIAQKGNVLEMTVTVKVAIIAWLLSLLLSFLVIFPFRYRCSSLSAPSIERMHRRIIRVKMSLLSAGTLSFFAALVMVAINLL